MGVSRNSYYCVSNLSSQIKIYGTYIHLSNSSVFRLKCTKQLTGNPSEFFIQRTVESLAMDY